MTRNVATIALFGLTLVACHHASSRAIHGPDGASWYRIVCRSNFREDCFDEAERLCPSGYAIGDRSQALRGFYTMGPNTMAIAEDEMIIRCAAAPSPTASADSELKTYRPSGD